MILQHRVGWCLFITLSLAACDEGTPKFLQRENPDVEEGNAALDGGDHRGALAAYDRAAAALPSQPGVHLDRGLALLANGDFATARQAFLGATEPPPEDEIHGEEYFRNVRRHAYHNMGLAYYLEGDAAATAENTEEAQRLFREAVDAYQSSLRITPGGRDTAWNLELARRRLQEQEDQENEDQENEDQENEDQESEDQESEDQESEDQESEDQESEDQENEDQENEDQENEDQENEDQEDEGDPEQDEDEAPQPAEPEPQENEEPRENRDRPGQVTPEDTLPEDVARALDALQESEGGFQRERARHRGRDRRLPTKDW